MSERQGRAGKGKEGSARRKAPRGRASDDDASPVERVRAVLGAKVSRPRVRWLERAAGLVVALCLVGLGWLFLVYPASVRSHMQGDVTLVVAEDASIDRVADDLARVGAIDSAWLFALYARLLGADEHLRRGTVRLRDDMSVRTVLLRVAEGYGESAIDVVIPEGFDRRDVARRLARWDVCDEAAFLAATEDRALLAELGIEAPSAEGYLFPDTYSLVTHTDPRELVRRFVAAYRRRTDELFARAAEDDATRATWARWTALGYDAHDALVLASVVEKEAVMRDEQPVIAGVFVNRLASDTFLPRHRLQADPTVTYGCEEDPSLASCAGFDGRRITRAMLEGTDNPYNSYRREGLPPGPICNPGLSAIRAVLGHAQHDYLYFVARGHGRHAFSATLDAHNDGVANLRERERSRGE